MEKIYLKRISERLNEKELKNVLGGIVPYEEGELKASLKCHNLNTSCWLTSCPSDTEAAQKKCKTIGCGGSYTTISCAE